MIARDPVEIEATFGFVDLAGFSALTETHGDGEALALLDRFETIVRAALGPGDRLVKMIGDAAMICFAGPEEAVEATERIVDACTHQSEFPVPRAGLHHGRALLRSGDLVGSAVNVAARVANQAAGGRTLATVVVAGAARTLGYDVVDLGAFELHNISTPVELYEIGLGNVPDAASVDPVCRMRVGRSRAVGEVRHHGTEYRFCSLDCAAAFASDPARYVRVRNERS